MLANPIAIDLLQKLINQAPAVVNYLSELRLWTCTNGGPSSGGWTETNLIQANPCYLDGGRSRPIVQDGGSLAGN
ncbi:MAG TPA: hypothetical protein VIH18_33845, partial [Candidatus Binatia bacterium]